jgi:hypothetical protein
VGNRGPALIECSPTIAPTKPRQMADLIAAAEVKLTGEELQSLASPACRTSLSSTHSRSKVPHQFSEQQFQTELNLARRICRRDRAKRGAVADRVRRSEVRMVQDVEEFTPELQSGGFHDAELFVDG